MNNIDWSVVIALIQIMDFFMFFLGIFIGVIISIIIGALTYLVMRLKNKKQSKAFEIGNKIQNIIKSKPKKLK
jgi:ABC-type methionine transport system permease subunit